MSDESTAPESYATRADLRSVPRLRWEDDRGSREQAVEGRTFVGSASSAALVVAHRSVSRLHGELAPTPGGLWVRDLGSLNGTWSGALRLREAIVPFGGRLRLGSVEVLVESSPAPLAEQWAGDGFGALRGRSRAMRELFAQLARVAASNASALVQGETGTGKELCAAALHEASPRRDGPFVVVDCGALPEALLESELFGHARGAFTGAVQARAGAFEHAAGGTLFLDEVGELPLTAQPKLLRALESKTVRRVGESAHRPVDVRIVSATHRDLLGMVACGAFREDLYFRLAVLPLRVPPLRERPDDVVELLDLFLQRPAREVLGSAVVDELARLPWLGNVRELRNFAERALALGPEAALALARARGDDPVTRPAPPPAAPAEFDPDTFGAGPFGAFREAWIERGEAQYITRLLERHGGNVASALGEAQVNRSHLYRLIKKYRK
jgi:two-component system, NtrC family, response regulator GlrR